MPLLIPCVCGALHKIYGIIVSHRFFFFFCCCAPSEWEKKHQIFLIHKKILFTLLYTIKTTKIYENIPQRYDKGEQVLQYTFWNRKQKVSRAWISHIRTVTLSTVGTKLKRETRRADFLNFSCSSVYKWVCGRSLFDIIKARCFRVTIQRVSFGYVYTT